jgi:hypothetical protein
MRLFFPELEQALKFLYPRIINLLRNCAVGARQKYFSHQPHS